MKKLDNDDIKTKSKRLILPALGLLGTTLAFRRFVAGLAVCLAVVAGQTASAQVSPSRDPVKVDAKHYKVEFENNEVRVLRVNYGPDEKSVMHDHPESVLVFLSDQKAVFTTPDGKSTEIDAKAGEVKHIPAGPHLPHNIGDKPMEIIVMEFKGKPATK